MDDNDPKKFDKLANFASDLREIEGRDGGVTNPARANEVRESLIAAMDVFVKSLYEFTERLDRYHALFKAKKTATAAMERIAAERGCSPRTLYRLLEYLRNSKQLPLFVVDVMREEGIDPVLGKHQSLVETLTTAPTPANRDEAKASLKAARAKVLKMAPVARKAHTVPAAKAGRAKVVKMEPARQEAPNVPAVSTTQTSPTVGSTGITQTSGSTGTVESAGIAIDEFTMGIIRMFEERFGSYRGADRDEQIRSVLERVVSALHADVRELRIDGRPDRVRKLAQKKP
ncbi:MAG: hypothetical protein ACLGSD_17300 [Acidobacteriota bacterium]